MSPATPFTDVALLVALLSKARAALLSKTGARVSASMVRKEAPQRENSRHLLSCRNRGKHAQLSAAKTADGEFFPLISEPPEISIQRACDGAG
jgi:hypothetical protein